MAYQHSVQARQDTIAGPVTGDQGAPSAEKFVDNPMDFRRATPSTALMGLVAVIEQFEQNAAQNLVYARAFLEPLRKYSASADAAVDGAILSAQALHDDIAARIEAARTIAAIFQGAGFEEVGSIH